MSPNFSLTCHLTQGAPSAPCVILPPSPVPGIPPYTGATPVAPASVTNVIAEVLSPLPEPSKPPGLGLVTGTVKAVLKHEQVEIPSAAKTVGVAVSAGLTAKKLVENIDQALARGDSPEEAYVCQAAKVLTEELSGKAMKGLVVGGVPAYLAAAVASPPLAATVPAAALLIPQAYQGAQMAAQALGNVAEKACHQGFSLAKKLTKKGN